MLRTLLVLAILSSGLVAGLFSRYAALLLYLWFAMFRPMEWMWVDLSQYRPSLLVGAMLVIPSLATGIFPAFLHPIGIGSIAFLACSLLAQLGAIRPDVGWFWIDYVTRLTVVTLLIPRIATTPRRVVIVFGVIAGSFLFHGAKAGLASIIGGGSFYAQGLAGAFIDNNGYAVGTAMAIFLFVGVAQTVKVRPLRWGMIATSAPLGAMAIVSLFSRGGLLALAAGTVVFIALQGRSRGMVLAVVLVVASVVFLPKPGGYQERISPVTGESELTEDSSAVSRMHFWKTAVDMAVARPFGVGLWNYSDAYDQFDSSQGRYGRRRAVHSSPLQMLAETGFAGFAAYMFMIGWTVRMLFKVRRRWKDPRLTPDDQRMYLCVANGAIASMAAFLVGGSTIALALNDMTWFTFGAAIALERLVPEQAAAVLPATAIPTSPWAASST